MQGGGHSSARHPPPAMHALSISAPSPPRPLCSPARPPARPPRPPRPPALARCIFLAFSIPERNEIIRKAGPLCAQGYDLAKRAALEFLEEFKQPADPSDRWAGRRRERQRAAGGGWRRAAGFGQHARIARSPWVGLFYSRRGRGRRLGRWRAGGGALHAALLCGARRVGGQGWARGPPRSASTAALEQSGESGSAVLCFPVLEFKDQNFAAHLPPPPQGGAAVRGAHRATDQAAGAGRAAGPSGSAARSGPGGFWGRI